MIVEEQKVLNMFDEKDREKVRAVLHHYLTWRRIKDDPPPVGMEVILRNRDHRCALAIKIEGGFLLIRSQKTVRGGWFSYWRPLGSNELPQHQT